mmetsp:Transcript_10485/g.14693  ORF Transcript_10485/g.14693 Transcript_10485/m.14693 type:complete len:162 (-) Transcript_10485:434-919(-)|eukprot:CAMPEP_0185728686 /NCGR_PEP_ID=MMETSP1171-20130828/4046_1 /TAXON_ID=374046 /ORGANISM="Helicotheca tamensis, Strain CCMP826" /LENGTH=161 /DNA_ID=CAMNT_0028397417 /DNA_START=162 /DNA_END=647 /DNA_ORIENTATION=-
MFLPAPKRTIRHTTDIDAPIEEVWASLVDIDSWKEWNKWTTLQAEPVQAGTNGKLFACFDGDGKNIKEYDFYFTQVNSEHFVLEWGGRVGPGGTLFRGSHSMSLHKNEANADGTTLVHEEIFGGLLPKLGMGLPYKTLDRNYLLMNNALKEHIESKRSESN